MMKAWIENGNVFIGPEECVPPDASSVIDVPEDATIEDIKIEEGRLVLRNTEEKVLLKKEELRNKIKELVIKKLSEKVDTILKENGYRSLGDLKIYADLNSEEAVSILQYYLRVDNLVWKFIEEDLQEMSLQELENFNVDEFIENCFRVNP